VSFADRLKEAAEATRDTIVKYGVSREGAVVHGVHVVDPDPEDLERAKRARRLGAPDPYSLITTDEVAALTGLPAGGPSLVFSDDDIGIRFEAEGYGADDAGGAHRLRWVFSVHIAHAVDDVTPFDPERWYRWMTDLLPGAEPVELGDCACYQDGLLYVMVGHHAIYVQVQAPDGSPTREWAVRLGERVLTRLATGAIA
jgi:hypothetical protein